MLNNELMIEQIKCLRWQNGLITSPYDKRWIRRIKYLKNFQLVISEPWHIDASPLALEFKRGTLC